MTDGEKLDLIINKLGVLEDGFGKLEKRFDVLENRFDTLENRLDALESDLKDIKFTIENEVRANLQAVAEGHLDLSRNLHDAIKM